MKVTTCSQACQVVVWPHNEPRARHSSFTYGIRGCAASRAFVPSADCVHRAARHLHSIYSLSSSEILDTIRVKKMENGDFVSKSKEAAAASRRSGLGNLPAHFRLSHSCPLLHSPLVIALWFTTSICFSAVAVLLSRDEQSDRPVTKIISDHSSLL